MRESRFTEQQIAFALRQAETGTKVSELCRKIGVAEPTFYNWKKKYGGLGVSELRRLKQLEERTDNNIEETIVYGPLCLQTDIISKTKLPKLNAGDHLIVKNVGAYNLPQSSTFIYAQPAVILVDGKNIKMIKKREDIKDIF